MELAVNMVKISKQFDLVLANDAVDFSVQKGEIHALVGENGAGKTTLMRILYGLYTPTAGQVFIHGEPVQFASPLQAIQKGIGMVHQHFMLIPRLSVAENIILGNEPGSVFHLDRRQAEGKVAEICAQYRLAVDPKARVRDLSLGSQQKAEIVKAIYRGAEILILDEPTAVLTPQEIDELGGILKHLKAQGMTIIIITHKLQEVKAFSDRVTVLRGGKQVAVLETADSSIEDITYLMVGRKVALGGQRETPPQEEAVLEVQNVSLQEKHTRQPLLEDISLTIRKGEILGIAGIDGSGQDHLVDVINGGVHPQQGDVLLEGRSILRESPGKRRENGVGIIPQDRHHHGLVLDFTVEENLVLGYQRRGEFRNGWLINFAGRKARAKQAMEQFDIRPRSEANRARFLSGGNQQKILISREVQYDPRLIIANQPTRGVDIGAIENIHNILMRQREAGKGILLISLELDELIQLSDRIAILYSGRLMGILDVRKATRELLGLMMVGHTREEALEIMQGAGPKEGSA